MKRIIPGTLGLAVALASLTLAAAPSVPTARSGANIPGSEGGPGGVTSYNWSGFAAASASAKRFTFVTAKWKVPKATCLGTVNESHAFWVGLDGFSDNTVEQGGTYAYCSGTSPSYYAWWEMYPTNDIQIAYGVFPGDSITASVTYASGKFKIVVNDTTTAHRHSFSTTQTCASGLTCTRSSAEWIGEAPTYGGSIGNLAEWSNTTAQEQIGFSSAYATAGGKKLGIGFFSYTGINMINQSGTYNLAAPGPVGEGGPSNTDFLDYWFAES